MSEDPLCQFDGCTQEAIVESEVRTTDQTYSKAFCEKHKQDGTNVLTNEVAALGKPPCAWDTRLTGKGKREKEGREKKRKEEAEQRQREWALEGFYRYGWRDSRFSEDGVPRLEKKNLSKGYVLDSIGRDEAYEQYIAGWNDAKKKIEEQGQPVFLLNELLAMMNAGDEWYGSDFDEPIALVEKVIELIKQDGSNERQ